MTMTMVTTDAALEAAINAILSDVIDQHKLKAYQAEQEGVSWEAAKSIKKAAFVQSLLERRYSNPQNNSVQAVGHA